MQEFGNIGKLLMFAGAALIIFGFILTFGHKVPFIGKLPGDILLKRGNSTFYFPVVTCIIISIIMSLLLSLFKR